MKQHPEEFAPDTLRVKLLPAQMRFLRSRKKEVLYSGAFGAGKTRALCYKLLTHAGIPGNFVGLCRKKHTSLKQTTLRTLLKSEGGLPPVLPPECYTHHKQDQIISIHGGGEIYHFGFDEETKVGSLNLGAAFVDEGIELEEDEYNMLLGRCRNPADPLRQLCISTNPGSPGHFLYRKFFEERSGQRQVVETKSLDNHFLPSDYLRSLRSLQGTAYDRYVLGKWVAHEGAVYPMFRRDRHIETKLPNISEVLLGVDFGFSQPACILVFTRVGEDTILIVDEIYQRGLTSSKICEITSSLCKDYPVYEVICDPSEPGTIEDMVSADVPAYPAENEVMRGIRAVQDRLIRGTLLIHSRCSNLIREIESYTWKDGRDEPIKVQDHAVDALRYGVLGWNASRSMVTLADRMWEPEDEEEI